MEGEELYQGGTLGFPERMGLWRRRAFRMEVQ